MTPGGGQEGQKHPVTASCCTLINACYENKDGITDCPS